MHSDGVHRFHVSHNAYLELLAECGWPSVVLFLSLLFVTLYRLERLRRSPVAPWIEVYARMMQISIVAYMTGSLFLNMAYFDLIYHLVALSVSLELVAGTAVARRRTEPAATPDPWWRRSRPAPVVFPFPGRAAAPAVSSRSVRRL